MPITQDRLKTLLDVASAWQQTAENIQLSAQQHMRRVAAGEPVESVIMFFAADVESLAPSRRLCEAFVAEKVHYKHTHKRNIKDAAKQARKRMAQRVITEAPIGVLESLSELEPKPKPKAESPTQKSLEDLAKELDHQEADLGLDSL